MPGALTAWTGPAPRGVRDAALASTARHAYARWDGRDCWVPSDRGTAIVPAPGTLGVVAYGRPPFSPRAAAEQPLAWEGWCLAHLGAIANPDRLWMGRVPSGAMALLKRLEWVGRRQGFAGAVRDVAGMLEFATDAPQTALVGSPDGAVHLLRLNRGAVAVLVARGPDWTVASTSPAFEGEPAGEGVTRL